MSNTSFIANVNKVAEVLDDIISINSKMSATDITALVKLAQYELSVLIEDLEDNNTSVLVALANNLSSILEVANNLTAVLAVPGIAEEAIVEIEALFNSIKLVIEEARSTLNQAVVDGKAALNASTEAGMSSINVVVEKATNDIEDVYIRTTTQLNTSVVNAVNTIDNKTTASLEELDEEAYKHKEQITSLGCIATTEVTNLYDEIVEALEKLSGDITGLLEGKYQELIDKLEEFDEAKIVELIELLQTELANFKSLSATSEQVTPDVAASVTYDVATNTLHFVIPQGETGKGIKEFKYNSSVTEQNSEGRDIVVDLYDVIYEDDTVSATQVRIANGAQGIDGQDGEAGVGIATLKFVSTTSPTKEAGQLDSTDTYKLTKTDGTSHEFIVTNGTTGVSVEYFSFYSTTAENGKPAQNGQTDTYRMTLSDGKTFDVDIVNGRKGDTGETGRAMTIDAVGTLEDRSTYDDAEVGFGYYASDSKLFYTMLSSGEWSEGIELVGNSIESIDFVYTTDVSGEPSQYGATDVYKITYNILPAKYYSIVNGVKGDIGDKGEKGDKGDKGETGDTGKMGCSGFPSAFGNFHIKNKHLHIAVLGSALYNVPYLDPKTKHLMIKSQTVLYPSDSKIVEYNNCLPLMESNFNKQTGEISVYSSTCGVSTGVIPDIVVDEDSINVRYYNEDGSYTEEDLVQLEELKGDSINNITYDSNKGNIIVTY